MKISVAMCTYNGSKYISEQLNSIFNQTLSVDEIVISDDCSSDNTVRLIKELMEMHQDITYTVAVNEKNLGFKQNFYSTIQRCTGDIIFFCDQDDVWHQDKVKKTVEYFQQNEKALLVFSDGYITDEKLNHKGRLLDSLHYKKEFMNSPSVQLERLLADNFVTGATSAIRKELVTLVNPLNYEIAHDYWYGVVATINEGLYCLEEPLISYRQHTFNTVGINKGIDYKLIKRLFSKEKNSSNRDNLYAEIRLPMLETLLDKEMKEEYKEIVRENYDFWKRREVFSKQGMIKNTGIVLKDAVYSKQRKHRNTDKPVLKDFVKGIALSKRDL